MSKFAKQRIPFEVEGQFLGFLPDKDGKLKYLRWQAEAEVFVGKIPKPLRSALYRTLKPGDRVQIAGEREVDLLKEREKWVLYRVVPLGERAGCIASGAEADPEPGAPKAKGKVLVCQKSNCYRRGAGAVMQALRLPLGCLLRLNLRAGGGLSERLPAGPKRGVPARQSLLQRCFSASCPCLARAALSASSAG
jgi:hypothetical protein